MQSELKSFENLGSVHRGKPCKEYPGNWIVFLDVGEVHTFNSFDAAYRFAAIEAETNSKVSVCWEASDNDPRLGEVWFTGFYCHGKFDSFGRYKS